MGLVIDKPLRAKTERAPEPSPEPPRPNPVVDPLSLGPGDPIAQGRYCILETIARSGDIVVYAAQQVAVGRRVAIKMRVGDESRMATAAEARVLAEVCVPNLIQIWDSDTTDGGSWLALEHGGPSLAGYGNDRKRISVPIAIRMVADVLFGLDALHQAGFVHRTLCPDHVLVNTADIRDEQGMQLIKVAGLGWACSPGTALVDTEVAQRLLLAHSSYLAPELMAGETVDLRADLYSVGLLLRYLLGEPPEAKAEPQRELPRELRNWLERATAPKPEARFPNAQVMRQELLDAPIKAAGAKARPDAALPVAVHARKSRVSQDTQPLGGLSHGAGSSGEAMSSAQSFSQGALPSLASQHALSMSMGTGGLDDLDRDGTPTRFMLVPARSQPSTALAPRPTSAMAAHLSTRHARQPFGARTQRIRRTEDGGQGLMVATGVVCLATIYWATNLDERGVGEVCAILDCGGVSEWGRHALTSVRDQAWEISQRGAEATSRLLELFVERIGRFLDP